MSDLIVPYVRHIVLTVNIAGLLGLVICWIAKTQFASDSKSRRAFVNLSLAVVLLKIAYILVFAVLSPERILSTDGARYLNETARIAEAPWQWNPLSGSGPGYNRSAKMGMSYAYGTFLFLHGVTSLYGVLALNVLCSFLTCVVVFLLTRKLSEAPLPSFLAMFLAAVYPETLYWNARVVRENLTLLLVPLFVYTCIRLRETYALRYFLSALFLAFALMLTRVQLALFLPLALVYFGITALLHRDRMKLLLLTVVVALPVALGLEFLKRQIKQTIGTQLVAYLTFDPAFWIEKVGAFLQTAPLLLSIFARERHGPLGALLAPAFLAVVFLFILSVVRFRAIFTRNAFAAGLLIFLSTVFIFVVASFGLVNIRFRATIMPLVFPLIAVTAYHYWQKWRLPRMAVFAGRPA